MNKIFKSAGILILAFCPLLISSCGSCKKSNEPQLTISGRSVTLTAKEEIPEYYEQKDPNIKRIDITPLKKGGVEELPAEIPAEQKEEKKSAIALLPPTTYEETDLTARLREKMSDAYAGQEDSIPDVKIYLSEMKYDEFVNYYKGLGYDVHTVAVPATQVIEPVLEQRPELKEKVNLSNYEDIVIHQVIIDGAGISAADKYIDPDSFEIIDKTFVTKTNK